ncbi:MAG: hypothetical protein ACREV8_06525, partial [Gammaproteobacteria bacterium]
MSTRLEDLRFADVPVDYERPTQASNHTALVGGIGQLNKPLGLPRLGKRQRDPSVHDGWRYSLGEHGGRLPRILILSEVRACYQKVVRFPWVAKPGVRSSVPNVDIASQAFIGSACPGTLAESGGLSRR